MARYYTDKGVLSKGACLMVKDTDGKYMLLIPTTNLPATRTAPATVEKTVLTDNAVTQVEGLQTNDQKTYTFNYHRDNLIQLNKFKGKNLEFIERNADDTGEKFTGTMVYGRSGVEVNGIEQGEIYITVTSSEDEPLEDVRDLVKKTAVITSPLNDITLAVGESNIQTIELSDGATVTATSESTTIATGTYADGKLTITGVAAGNTMINLVVSKTGEATSYRTIAVTVE
jgi:hypothetical protein